MSWSTDKRNGRRVIDERGDTVANVPATRPIPSLAFERAKKLAAAQDLLEACKAQLERHDARARAANFGGCGCDDCMGIRAIVAKAEGRQ